MSGYILYNDDVRAASFTVKNTVVIDFIPEQPALLPMQLCRATADGFTSWLRERAIDLNSVQHRNLMNGLVGSRDKTTIALRTHMFSISDTFTCFEEGDFTPRDRLCLPEDQRQVSDFILVSSDTSLRGLSAATPNASTDGSFTKTWKYENDAWWLFKLQSGAATEAEVNISRVLRDCGWNAAVYEYAGRYRKRVRTLNFVQPGEFFEPYDSFRFRFENLSDDENVIFSNLSSLGPEFRRAWKRILLADALFLNTDRHMRNFGVIRSAVTGEVLRLAPNFDNNQAYLANPGGKYTDIMLKQYMEKADDEDYSHLAALNQHLQSYPYLKQAYEASLVYVK